jgi:RNA polymerase sigma factor (sigma-70 family)
MIMKNGAPSDVLQMDDQQLLVAISNENYNAFNTLYHKYVQNLTHYGLKFTSNPQIVEDCLHDLFTWLWKIRDSVNINQSLKAYLFKSVRTAILQKVGRERKNENLNDEENAYPFQLSLSAEDQFIDVETQRLLKEKVSSLISLLTAKQKEVIYLRYYEDLSFDEISQSMNLSTKACYKLMGRAVAELRKTMPQGWILLILFLR